MEDTVKRLQDELENTQVELEIAHTELEITHETDAQVELELRTSTTEAELDKLQTIESL